MKKVLFALLLAAAAAGCSTVKVTSVGDRTMVDVENTCWYLLMCIPVGSGDPDTPNQQLCKWFENSVTLRNNVKMVEYAMEKKGAHGIKDLTSRFADRRYSFLLKRYSLQTSAELIK